MAADRETPGKSWLPDSPAAEFEAWLAANPAKLPDHRKYQLRPRPIGKPLTPQAARRRLLIVALAMVATVIAMTWLLTFIGRAAYPVNHPPQDQP